jgi:hypothetical protein
MITCVRAGSVLKLLLDAAMADRDTLVVALIILLTILMNTGHTETMLLISKELMYA